MDLLDHEEHLQKILNLKNSFTYKAFIDLNRTNIIQGFVFSDKSYFRAFQHIKNMKEKQKKKKKWWLLWLS